VLARIEADRGSDLRGRTLVHAVLGERHGGVRRLYARAAGDQSGGPGGDEEDSGRGAIGGVRAGVDRGEQVRTEEVFGYAGGGSRAAARAGRGTAAGDDAVLEEEEGGGSAAGSAGGRGELNEEPSAISGQPSATRLSAGVLAVVMRPC